MVNSVPGVTGEDSDMLTRADGVALGSVLTINSTLSEVNTFFDASHNSTISSYLPVEQVLAI